MLSIFFNRFGSGSEEYFAMCLPVDLIRGKVPNFHDVQKVCPVARLQGRTF